MRVIKIRGLSVDTFTPALSPTERGGFYDTLLRERELWDSNVSPQTERDQNLRILQKQEEGEKIMQQIPAVQLPTGCISCFNFQRSRQGVQTQA